MYNPGSNNVQIQIPPIPATGIVMANKGLLEKPLQPGEWILWISAESGFSTDRDNYVGCLQGAEEARDRHDYSKAPPIVDCVSSYFPYQDWEPRPGLLGGDFRPVLRRENSWEIEVRANMKKKVRLRFDGIESFPSELKAYLVDDVLHTQHNLHKSNEYVFAGTDDRKRFRILVGISDYKDVATILPDGLKLNQNFPNPFNPMTTMRYGIAESGNVMLSVYKPRGKKVISLVDNEYHTVGYYSVIWNGRDENNRLMNNGVYIYRLQRCAQGLIRKMTFVK